MPPEDARAGVLVSVHKNKVEVMLDYLIIEGRLAPNVPPRGLKDFAVGDRVWVDGEDEKQVLILGREARKSSVGRTRGDRTRHASSEWQVLAANVDVGVITVAIKNPDLHLQFIDRYLILLQDGGVQPVICSTKGDLSSERPSVLDFYESIGVPVIETSCLLNRGIDELKALLLKKVAVFVGQSGVGKSSLIKALDPSLEIATQAVSPKTGKGQHTTTKSNLYRWAEDSFIIDTPGTRSLGVEVIPKEQIRFLFPEFFELAAECKYRDCLHLTEPGCAIKQALSNEERVIDKRRYESYARMMEE
ncbi:MAG: ribosome small subunit-dependent GTPase A [Patescibacteria group bacterium]